MKTSKTARILALLDKGMAAKKVAEKVGTSPNYVYYVKWNAAKKTEKKPAARKLRSVVEAAEFSQAAAQSNGADLTMSEDEVNHPSHYTAGGIETIDYIEAKSLNYNLGNVIKYVSRANLKNVALEGDIKDLEKAQWYLKREIETLRKAL